jgi:hypothetical protein
MAKSKKYSHIHIEPTGNGHMVRVHHPMNGSQGASNPMAMAEPDKDENMHFGDADAAAAHVKSILQGHDGDKPSRGKHPLKGAFGQKSDHDEDDES